MFVFILYSSFVIRHSSIGMRVLLIFIDGVGIGQRNTETNPFARIDGKVFRQFVDEPPTAIYSSGVLQPTDASLQTPGLPQSATGQAAILTGVNASRMLGYHLSGFPNHELKELLARESIFIKLRESGRSATFANAYQPSFFTQEPRRISVTTAACQSAGLRLRTLEDLAAGNAVYHDITHRYLQRLGYDLPLRSPEDSGANLATLAAQHDFTLYEYFITDFIGHGQDMETAIEILVLLERFLCSVVDHIDGAEQFVLLTSDHGNIEDLSRKGHTLNAVPTIAWGRRAPEITTRISSIQDITPFILSLLH
jgi:hypothetical protein